MINESRNMLDIISDYWAMIVAFVIFIIGYAELRMRVKSHGDRIDKIETTMRDDMHRVEDKIDANHKEIIGYIQGLGK